MVGKRKIDDSLYKFIKNDIYNITKGLFYLLEHTVTAHKLNDEEFNRISRENYCSHRL